MELFSRGVLHRTISKERLDCTVEVVSFIVAVGVLSLSVACTEDACLEACVDVSMVYSSLMFLTCIVLCLGRRYWPGVDLVRTETAISGLRWLLTGPLAIPAIYLQAESLKDDIWLRTFHFFFSGMCFVYIVMVAPLPLLHRAACAQATSLQRQQLPCGDRSGELSAYACLELGAVRSEECWKTSDRTCCICCERPADAMCLPCRHASTCEACLLRLLSSPKAAKCPVCRAAITSYDVTADASGYVATFVAPPKAAFDPANKVATGVCRPQLRSYIRFCCPAMCTSSPLPMLPGP